MVTTPEKNDTMGIMLRNLTHDEARTIEAQLIYARLSKAKASGYISGFEAIETQLKKAGLKNKNRGRVPERWLNPKTKDNPTNIGVDLNHYLKDSSEFDEVF